MHAVLCPPDAPAATRDDVGVGASRRGWYEWSPLAGRSDVLCVERTARDAVPHLHERLQLSLVQRPTVSTDAVGRRYIALAGALLTVNPYDLHGDGSLGVADSGVADSGVAARDDRGWYVRELHVGATVLDDVLAGLRGARARAPIGSDVSARPPASWFPMRVVNDDALSAGFNTLWDEMRDDMGATIAPVAAKPCGVRQTAMAADPRGARGLARALERESRLLGWLAVLVARHARRLPALRAVAHRDVAVRRAREYLHGHVRERVLLSDLAEVAGVNKFSLIRAFERELGLAPHAYQTQVRLARARRLIERGEPLSHVSFDAGFADQSHLTRQFKTFFGLTPGQYARCGARPGAPRRDEAAASPA